MSVQEHPAPPPVTPPRVPVIRMGTRERIPPLGHQPALDGLRAVAVAAVLVFHARFPWAEGGFLGVSAFFTLSGFLITSLLLREWGESASLDVRRFWSRRFRRLLPASWLTIGLVLLMGALGVWSTDQLRDLRSDVPFALLEVINWHFISEGRSYGADFAAPSPLEHFWSLAIEQQFYLLFPLLMAVLLTMGSRVIVREGGGGTRRMGVGPAVVALGGLAVASALLNARWGAEDPMRAYFGTLSRLFELLVGAVLACVMLRRTVVRSAGPRAALGVLGLAGLVGSVWLFHAASLTATWLYPWGFLLMAACTSALITGVLQGGVLGAALSLGPLVALGRISYGVYLLHWPVFLWLTPARVGWAPWPLFALRLAVTLAGAVAMFRVLERPVRTGSLLRGRTVVAAVPLAALALVAGTLVVTDGLPGPTSLEQASAEAGDGVAGTRAATPPPALRTLMIGDELTSSAPGAFSTGGDTPMDVAVASTGNCGLALGGWVRLSDGGVERDVDRCAAARDTWAARLAAERPEVVLVWAGLRDVADRRFDVDSPWRAPGDPVLDDFLRTEVGSMIDLAASAGARVVVLTVPHVRNTAPSPPAIPPPVPTDPARVPFAAAEATLISAGAPPVGAAENQDLRMDTWNLLLQQAAASRGVPVIDVAARMRAWPSGEFDPALRAGGVGVTPAGSQDLGAWLAPLVRATPPTPPPAPTASSVLDPNAPLPPAPPVGPRRTVPAGRAVNVMVVGDSVAHNYGFGLAGAAADDPDLRSANASQFGCPVARGGSYRFLRDVEDFPARCDWAPLFPGFLGEQNPDVVVLTSGIWEVVDRRFPGDDRWRQIGRPEVDRYILREFVAAIDTLASTGASVVLVTYPHLQAGADQGFTGLPESDPVRIDRLNELMAEAAGQRPGVATVIDIRPWLTTLPGGEFDPAKRSDGIHFTDGFSREIGRWLAPQVVGIGRTGL